MRARLVFEKFSEDGDPIVDMGIGIKQVLIKKAKELLNISWNESGEIVIDHIVYNNESMIINIGDNDDIYHIYRYLDVLMGTVDLHNYIYWPPEIKGKNDYHGTMYNIDLIFEFKEMFKEIFKTEIIIDDLHK